jgi:hypothetical protein
MAWRNTLDLQVLCGIAGELEDFGGEVFEDSGDVDGSCGCQLVLVAMKEAGSDYDSPFAPTRILFCVLFLRKRLTRPQGNWVRRNMLAFWKLNGAWKSVCRPPQLRQTLCSSKPLKLKLTNFAASKSPMQRWSDEATKFTNFQTISTTNTTTKTRRTKSERKRKTNLQPRLSRVRNLRPALSSSLVASLATVGLSLSTRHR